MKVVVIGAAGRMGRRLVSLISAAEDLLLTGAVEYSESPFLGEDSGVLSGVAENHILITDDLSSVLNGCDAVIDFSTNGVLLHARLAVEVGAAVIIGTTALPQEDRDALKILAEKGRILLASNMSVGVNLLFYLVKEAAKRLSDDYDIEIVEMHHNQKKDAPSGTAVSLAEKIADAKGLELEKTLRHGRVGMVGARTRSEIGMHAIRGGDVVGDHTVMFAAAGERLELTHKATSRDAFAQGALTAVRSLCQPGCKPGLYDMQDILHL